MKKRKAGMLLAIIALAVGFAAVSTSLILTGTVGIGANEDDFDVIFTEATINGEDATATIDEATKRTIAFTSSVLTNVKDKAILNYKVKNNSTQYDADVTINCTNDASEFIKVTNTLADEEIAENFKTTFNAQEEKSGVITAEMIKSYTEANTSIGITCEIVASAKEKDSAVEIKNSKWVITEDNDIDGEVSFGDLITLGDDSFYVYDTTGDTVKVLSKESLDCGMVDFSTADVKGENRSSYEGSLVQQKVNEYKGTLDSDAGIVNARIITKEELESLGCNTEKASCKAGRVINELHNYVDDATFVGAPNWVHVGNMWTMTAYDANEVWRVLVQGNFDHADVRMMLQLPVRPVLEISKSAL